MERSFLLALIFILLISLASAITGESITGGASSAPTNVSVFVQPSKPVIYIYSPENITYYNTNILFNYSIGNNLSQTWYNLDNSANITLGNLTNNSLTFTTTEGNYILYLYANNSFGESMKSVSFTVSSQAQPPPQGNNGGNSGGGGNSITSVTAFDLEKNLLQVSLIQGEAKTEKIKITNVGSTRAVIDIVTSDLNDFVLIEEKNITINAGETKEVSINFFALSDKLPNIYFGRIIFTSGSFRESVVAVIELKQKQALFDVNVDILPNYKVVPPGKKISAIIDMTNIGLRDTAVDVELLLYLTDDEKTKISEISKETIAVKNNLSITRKIEIPDNTQNGIYFLIADLKYNDLTASSYDAFEIKSGVGSNFISYIGREIIANPIMFFLVLIVIILLVIIIFILIKRLKESESVSKKKIKKKGKAFYKPFVKEED